MEQGTALTRGTEFSASGTGGTGSSEAPQARANPTSIAFNETPSPMPTVLGPTQIPDPVYGKYNDPASVLNLLETQIVEL